MGIRAKKIPPAIWTICEWDITERQYNSNSPTKAEDRCDQPIAAINSCSLPVKARVTVMSGIVE